MPTTLRHFTHLPHPLKEVSEDKEFKCDGCERLGIGQRYQCQECNFNLHMHCGHCPTDLLSFIHPKHRLHLALVRRSSATFSNEEYGCEVCGEGVKGLFYQCKRCEIYVHPLCSQLPQYVRYKTKVEHSLELQWHEGSNSCAVCGDSCSRWCYQCRTCPVVLHIDCLLSMLLPLRSPPFEKKRSTFLSSSSKKRSTMAWWWYSITFVIALQLLYLVMRF